MLFSVTSLRFYQNQLPDHKKTDSQFQLIWHQKTFEAVITATRPMEDENVKAIITFETPSGTEWIASSDPRRFTPNLFIEVFEKNLLAKIKGMECYEFEKRKSPHPRSPESLTILAKQRGLTIGKKYAEAFCIIRLIN